MASFYSFPQNAKSTLTRFTVSIADDKLQQMKQLIKLSPIGVATYENSLESGQFGLSRSWLRLAKKEWEESFNWRTHEKFINSFPNYKLDITDDDGSVYSIHFVAMFSTNPSAIPVAFFHGWPGSFLEFLPMLSLLKERYATADKLPYHIVVPSLPGYAFSDSPPLDKNWSCRDSARLMHRLLCELGFEQSGYVAQGGDIGSIISRTLARTYAQCKAVHLNFSPAPKPEGVPDSAVDELEAKQLKRAELFFTNGRAYALEHATRPATIGLVLSASPVALLAWIGEKFLDWTDEDPPINTILASVSLYWLTDTFPTSVYPYREMFAPKAHKSLPYCDKPTGYSWFPMELAPAPKAWVETTAKVVWHRQHTEGGHFAALEKPYLLLADTEDFVKSVWAGATAV
ncbi:Alpha/Beta hydrolase protein [Macrophomina phaseolina]|uniref:Alpha/Beta hydrolase protein n=1 Tax=Macrophomina phaseolina TaxID=35725 RepID=A0ABQ8G498_9PEZI|nr:Alpha/Beta hydrolase protein [Macrophomina phaseolina]